MKKLFIYEVDNYEFSDTEAFGQAWKQAKEKAAALHTYISRFVVRNEDDIQQEFFCKGGCFLNAKHATPEKWEIF